LTGLLVLVHCLRPLELRHLRISDVRLPDELDVGPRCIKLAPPVVAALDRFLAWRAESYTGPSRYLLISAAGRVRDQPIGKQTLSGPTFLGTSPTGLRQTAIRCLVQLELMGSNLQPKHACSSLLRRSISARLTERLTSNPSSQQRSKAASLLTH